MIDLNFPELEEPFATALHEAVDYILARFENVVGIIVAGSVLRGEGDIHSDIDTYIIMESNYRQRVQKFFNGVRFELFANAPKFIEQYLIEEPKDGALISAHMISTGHIILNRSAIVDELIKKAQDSRDAKAEYTEQKLTFDRYMLADRIENGLDLRERDSFMGQIIIDSAIQGMLVYQFMKKRKWIPRYKDLLKVIRIEEPELAKLVEDYYRKTGDTRFDIAGKIADYTLGVRGFFEWESDKDYLD